MNEHDNHQIIALLEPIAPERPAGSEIEYEALYDQIRAARQQQEAVEGEWAIEAKLADWARVDALSCKALTEHSKHFQVASWLTEAWLQRQNLTGLLHGIELMSGMIQLWWRDGFPLLDEEGEAYRLAIFARLDRDISHWLLTQSLSSSPQCALAWWLKVLRHEHRISLMGDNYDADDHEYSMETFRQWSARALNDAQIHHYIQQMQHCLNGIDVLEESLSSMVVAGAEGVMQKTREALENWLDFLGRIAEWFSPAADDRSLQEPTVTSSGQFAKPHRSTPTSMTRELAISQMMAIAHYFQRQEPSSPVPMLMERAVRWANMSLTDWLEEMVRDESCLREINHVLKGPRE